MHEKIVITGMGAISPLGNTAEESWKNALGGMSGVGPITLFDASDFLVQAVCEVKGFDPSEFMRARDARRRDRFEHFAVAAAKMALADSGYEITPENAGRTGVIVSSAIGGFKSFQDSSVLIHEEGPRKVSPFMIPKVMSNGGAGLIGIETGAKGISFSVASACASGSDGIGTAWHLLRAGAMDVAVTGGAEATITSLAVAAFDRLQAMSRQTDNTPRPFDRARDGLIMGEGAGVFILERESHAQARGARIYAEMAGYGATADAFHITAPSEDGAGGAAAMAHAMDAAGVNPDEIGYISAHGTATPLNDAMETKAVKAVFGERAKSIPISSTKSMTGHMMGATGALEAIFCAYAVSQNKVPPTINYENPDPACDLDVIPNEARDADVKVALSNAFGFGGHNTVLCIRAYDG